ncbi:phosphatidylinositol-binding protein [Hanseniaspora uvarum]|nr:phosphatidylinositol-binding protein [Hanseniaspora uvarum]
MSVNIVPDNITYYPPFDEASKTAKITITNTTDEPVTFKVKTTTPKNYCVKPNSEVLKPHQKMDVSIVYLGNDNDLLLSHDPTKPYRCKHKFLIESIPCPYEITDVHKAWASLGTEMKSQLQYKVIRVAFDFVNKNPLLEESKKEDIVEESDIKEDTKDGVEEPIESTIEEPTKSVVEEPENVEVEQPTNDEHEEEVGNKTVETIYKDDKIEEEEVEKPAVKSTEETKVVESDNNSSFNPIFIVIVAIIAYFAFQMKK